MLLYGDLVTLRHCNSFVCALEKYGDTACFMNATTLGAWLLLCYSLESLWRVTKELAAKSTAIVCHSIDISYM